MTVVLLTTNGLPLLTAGGLPGKRASDVPAPSAVTIGALADQDFDLGSGTRTYDIGALTTGGGAKEFGLAPVVIEPSITDAGNDTYFVSGRYGGTPTPVLSFDWKLDGASLGAPNSLTYDHSSGDGGTLTCTVTATNEHDSDVETSPGIAVPDNNIAPGSATADTTYAVAGSGTSGTLTLGGAVTGSRIWVITVAGGSGLTTSGLNVTGGTESVVGSAYTTVNRPTELWEVTGVSGSTSAGYTTSAADVDLAVWRTTGLAFSSFQTARQDASNTTSSVLTFSVPNGGAALVFAKKYETLTEASGRITDLIDIGTGADAMVAGYWINTTGGSASVTYTASTSTATSAKHLSAAVLELG